MSKAIDLPLGDVKMWPLLLGLAGFEDPPGDITREQAVWFRQLILATVEEYKVINEYVDSSPAEDAGLDIRGFDD